MQCLLLYDELLFEGVGSYRALPVIISRHHNISGSPWTNTFYSETAWTTVGSNYPPILYYLVAFIPLSTMTIQRVDTLSFGRLRLMRIWQNHLPSRPFAIVNYHVIIYNVLFVQNVYFFLVLLNIPGILYLNIVFFLFIFWCND